MWWCEGAEGLTTVFGLTTGQMQCVVLTDFMSTDNEDPELRGFGHQQQPWWSPLVSDPWIQIRSCSSEVQLVRLYYALKESCRGIMVKKTKGHYIHSQNSHIPATHMSTGVSSHIPSKPVPRCLISKWVESMTQIKLVEDLGWWAALKVSDDLLSKEDLEADWRRRKRDIKEMMKKYSMMQQIRNTFNMSIVNKQQQLYTTAVMSAQVKYL